MITKKQITFLITGILFFLLGFLVEKYFSSRIIDFTVNSKNDDIDLVLEKYSCSWDNPEIKSQNSFNACVTEIPNELDQILNLKITEYFDLLNKYPSDDLYIMLRPYNFEYAIESVNKWRENLNQYITTRCEVETSTAESGSGTPSTEAICEMRIYQNSINLIDERMESSKKRFAEIKDLVESGTVKRHEY